MKIFMIGRVGFFFSWAKTGTWEITKDDSKRTLYFSILKVTRNEQDIYGFILGPIAAYIGIV